MVLSNLKLIRLQKGITQLDVAKALQIDQTYLSKLENKHEVLTDELLKKLAEYYGVEQKELI